ncbi:MAG: hypothetical protein WCJ19_00800 [bacterium]
MSIEKKYSWAMLITLAVSFVLGMIVNLFIEFPEAVDEKPWAFAMKNIFVVSHIVLGTILVTLAIILVIKSVRSKDKIGKIINSLGLIAIFIAAAMGSEFIESQNEVSSLIMAIGFVVSFLLYSWNLVKK